MVKGCTLGKDSANELMGDFTAALLVRALRIAVENPAPYFSEFGTLNGYGVSKFAASVCQDNWEQTTILFVSKNVIQPFKNLRDRPCSVSVSQECQHEIRVAEEYRQQHLAAFASLYRVNLHNRSSLTMWNYYAKGNGTNLKFSATSLINCLKAHLHNNTLGKLAFLHGRVVYDQAKQSEILKNLLSDFSKTKPFADEWYLFTSWAILNVGTLFKHPKFKDENEYRIAYNILSDIYSPNKCVSLFKDAAKNEPYYIEVYERENMLVPYIDVDFNPNIVEEIRVSPRLSSEYTIDGLKLALMSNGFDVSKVKLKNSDIPLRF